MRAGWHTSRQALSLQRCVGLATQCTRQPREMHLEGVGQVRLHVIHLDAQPEVCNLGAHAAALGTVAL